MEWVKKVVLPYNFDTIQKLRFELLDEDDGDSYDFLGVSQLSQPESIRVNQFCTGNKWYCCHSESILRRFRLLCPIDNHWWSNFWFVWWMNASPLPISIIIVRVGNAYFDNMDPWDSDDSLLSAGVRRVTRDIVQFVPLNKFLSCNGPNQFIKSQADLAKEVLAEIPAQLANFMKLRGIKRNATYLECTSKPLKYCANRSHYSK